MGNDEFVRELGRIVAEAYYDHQDIRIAMMNRLRSVIRRKIEGIPFGEPEEKKEQKTYDKKYSDENLPILIQSVKNEMTAEEKEYVTKILNLAKISNDMENEYKKVMLAYIKNEPIWKEFLQHITGVSVILTANLLSAFGYCERYNHVSALWKHCGLHVEDGIAPKRRHGQKLDFNPKLRTLAWKIGDCLIKAKNPVYKALYDDKKERELQKEYPEGYLYDKYGEPYKPEDTHLTRLHAHNRAKRFIEKVFMENYFCACKELTGQDTPKTYAFDHLKHPDYIYWRDVVKSNIKYKEQKALAK